MGLKNATHFRTLSLIKLKRSQKGETYFKSLLSVIFFFL